MIKLLKYLLAGIVFGIILTKGEVISWYRIYEMFRFESFHMYGVIGSAVILGAIGIQIIKKSNMKDIDGNEISIENKKPFYIANLIGGTIFGLGWAMTGACPAPLFIQVGAGIGVFLVTIAFAVLGTYVYGVIRDKLPH
jgi:uncharacterized membrane protein YedE/YeeE